MLSTLRVASRSAAAREAHMRTVVIGARHASAWSNVPQGPPVSLFPSAMACAVPIGRANANYTM